MLSNEERNLALNLARRTIDTFLSSGQRMSLNNAGLEKVDKQSDFYKPLGCFVTLKNKDDGRLRGCIGSIVSDEPLYVNIIYNAINAATRDPRFSPLDLEELGQNEIEISIMGQMEPVRDHNEIKVGTHGLMIRRGNKSGLLLPQVPIEFGWDKNEFLIHLCHKAGLEPDELNSSATDLYKFKSEVFGEH